MKGVENGIEHEPPAYIFLLGTNEWLAFAEWPPSCNETSFYLHSRGNAQTLLGDGILSTRPPGTEAEDSYRYDPLDPVRTSWSIGDGPVDDRLVTTRPDLLCYTSEMLLQPLDVIGWPAVQLFASSSAIDTDWHVRLCDVYPDGSARFLSHGALRARFRQSFEQPVMLSPNEPTQFDIEMGQPVANRFLPGHRIRLEVTELVVRSLRPEPELWGRESILGRQARRCDSTRLPPRGTGVRATIACRGATAAKALTECYV